MDPEILLHQKEKQKIIISPICNNLMFHNTSDKVQQISGSNKKMEIHDK